MLKNFIVAGLIVMLLNLAFAPSAFALDKASKEAKLAAKVKKGIAKLGTGKDARIKVKLKDGTKLKGYVSEITEDSFTVTDLETGTATVVPYSSAKQVRGNNLSTGMMVTIGFIVLIVVILIILEAQKENT